MLVQTHLSGVFLELDHHVSLNFALVLGTLNKLCVTELDFLEKLFLPPKLGKWAKNRVFEFKEKLGR